MQKYRKGFFAFPGMPLDLSTTIKSAADLLKLRTDRIGVTIWPQMDIFGASIPEEVRKSIRESDFVVCDVTKPNLNVYYEAGYAIGLGKNIAPVVNAAFADAVSDIQKDGLFDNIGFRTYENSEQLASVLESPPSTVLLDLHARPLDAQQPLFILDSLRKTDFRNAIVSAVKDSKVFYRSFDPVEDPRLSTVYLINEVTASSGVVIPLLPPHLDDATRHNLRAAFLAGMSHGLGRQTLLIQRSDADSVIPADYRETVLTVRSEAEVADEVKPFALSSILAGQSLKKPSHAKSRSALQQLRLGAHSAENEFRTLEEYFVETSEYLQTLRGEVSVVAGRKGSGKTAIFFQVRDRFRSDRENSVTDLKPESHQLSLFRDELLKLVGVGVYDHTLAAFWYFLILSEIVITIKRNYESKAKRDGSALNVVRELDHILDEFQIADSGDFTTRINRLSRSILQEVDSLKSRGQSLTPERLTNIVFRGGIPQMKAAIVKYTDEDGNIVLLFDNIDKGWPTKGVHEFDIRLVRLLVETLDKVRRDFSASDRNFISVVFLRNDIYELLVDQTPDRGKDGQMRIDWTDRAKLKQVILRRLQYSTGEPKVQFNDVWRRYFPNNAFGKDSFEYLVDHCLMRPRFLLNIIQNAVSNGINRGHEMVDEDDLADAVRQHSNYLVGDFGYEIRDASGISADILYSLVGVTKYLTKNEVLERFSDFGLPREELEQAFNLMLWYGVLGVVSSDGKEHFIYSHDYSAKRLDAEVRRAGAEALFVTNAALHVALSS